MHGFLIAAVLVAGIAAVFDWRTGHMPNWLTMPPLLIAPVAYVILTVRATGDMNEALQEGGLSLGGALVCVLVPLFLYRQNAIGGGDIKVLAAIGAIGQVSVGIEMELYGFLAMAILAPAKLAYDGKLLQTIRNTGRLMTNSVVPKEKRKPIEAEAMSWVRMGPAIFLGTVISAVTRWKMQQP